MRSLNPIAFMTIATFISAPAYAVLAPTATADISNIELIVTDLDPLDGFAPAVTYSGVTSYVSVSSPNLSNGVGDGFLVSYVRRRDDAVPLSASFPATPGFWSTASASLDGGWVGNMSVSTFVPDAGFISSAATFAFDFQISPLTALTVNADITAWAAVPGVALLRDDGQYYASVNAYTLLLGPLVNLGGAIFRAGPLTVFPQSTQREESAYTAVSYTFENLSNEFRAGRVEFQLNAVAQNTIAVMAPVPEPKPYLMFAASLFVIALVRKRRHADG